MIDIRNVYRFISCLLAVSVMIAAFAIPCASYADGGFSVRNTGRFVSHKENYFAVRAPEEGTLTIRIFDKYHEYRVINEEIPAGESQVAWDGCSYNLEKINTGNYTFSCFLAGKSGKEYNHSFTSSIASNAQFLQFALPSSETAYMQSPDEWFLEAKTILDGKLKLEFFSGSGSEPVYSVQRTMHKGRVEHFILAEITEKIKPVSGNYQVRVYETSRPDNVFTFPLRLIDGELPRKELCVTGDIMPSEDSDDETIWKAMTEPAFVVDADYQESQDVYSACDLKSSVLGTLHGRTQCLSVYEISGEWARVGAWNHEDASYMEGWIPAVRLTAVYPSQDYGLLLSKKDQTLTVYYRGKKIETLMVSTGRMAENKYFRETSAGCYVTGLHRVDFSMQGSRYDFVIQYDGGNLLHQIPYSSDGHKDFTRGKPYLGAKASHACIRIQDTPGPQAGLNAYWIWTHIPYRTKLIIFDDPMEREKEKAVLSGNVPYLDSRATIITAAGLPEAADDGEAVITFGGDVIPGDREGAQNNRNSFKKCIDQFGTDYPLSLLNDIFSGDDLTYINLACVLKSTSRNADQRKKTTVRGLPEYAKVFANASVEVVNLVNDRTSDYKQEGFDSTTDSLGGICNWIGREHPLTAEIKGCLFGFASCTEKDYIADRLIIDKDIRRLKEIGCKYIVYHCYWGEEKDLRHNTIQNAMARACERAGADLVIGNGPNAPQGIDYINSMPVVYSLGKLVFGGSASVRSYDALLVRAYFNVNGEKKSPRIQLIPVLCSSSSKDRVNDYRPLIAEGEDRTRILNAIQQDTAYTIVTAP